MCGNGPSALIYPHASNPEVVAYAREFSNPQPNPQFLLYRCAACAAFDSPRIGSRTRSACLDRDPLPCLLDRAIDVLLLSFAIAFVRKISRSKSLTRFALWDPVSQGVDGIGEVYARLVSAVYRPRAEVLDIFEIRISVAWASHRGDKPPCGFARLI